MEREGAGGGTNIQTLGFQTGVNTGPALEQNTCKYSREGLRRLRGSLPLDDTVWDSPWWVVTLGVRPTRCWGPSPRRHRPCGQRRAVRPAPCRAPADPNARVTMLGILPRGPCPHLVVMLGGVWPSASAEAGLASPGTSGAALRVWLGRLRSLSLAGWGADSDQGLCVAHTELAGGVCRASYLGTHIINTIVWILY